tara:strand:+ start:2324 stop:2584 length:261 start_codon:yes stop_codon:yes gene_type:complete
VRELEGTGGVVICLFHRFTGRVSNFSVLGAGNRVLLKDWSVAPDDSSTQLRRDRITIMAGVLTSQKKSASKSHSSAGPGVVSPDEN